MNTKSLPNIRDLAEDQSKPVLGPITLLSALASALAVMFNYFLSPEDFRPIALTLHICLMCLGGYWIVRPPAKAQLCLLFVSFYLIGMAASYAIGQVTTDPIVGLGVIWFAATYFILHRELIVIHGLATIGSVCVIGYYLSGMPGFWGHSGTFFIIFLGGIGLHVGRHLTLKETVASHIRLIEAAERERLAELKSAEVTKLSSLTNLARGVAHDFNNLLQGIVGGLDLLETARDDQERKKFIDVIRSSTDASQKLCHQLMEVAGGRPAERESIDVMYLFQECKLASGDSDRLIVSVPEEAVFIEGDFSKLQRLLLNLLGNALDATRGDQGKVHLGAKVTTNHVELWVKDDGPGVSKEDTQRIFEPFYSNKQGGRGLGLAVASAVAREHDSELTLTPLERGAKFSVTLPLSAKPEKATSSTNTSSQAELEGSGKWIMLVDDEPLVLEVAERLLTSMDFNVATFNNGDTALADFSRHPAGHYCCAIVDSKMPGMSGDELITKLREQSDNLPIILCSGHVSLGREASADQCFNAFLPKPYRRSDLVSVLEKVS